MPPLAHARQAELAEVTYLLSVCTVTRFDPFQEGLSVFYHSCHSSQSRNAAADSISNKASHVRKWHELQGQLGTYLGTPLRAPAVTREGRLVVGPSFRPISMGASEPGTTSRESRIST